MNLNHKFISQLCVCLGICFFIGISNSFAQISYTIISNIKVGAITAKTTEADLKKIYGEKNVQSADVGLGEGETAPGTVIYPNDEKRKIEIVWKDQESKKFPDFVQLTGDKSLWKTKEGISLGTSLKRLEKINGKSFTLLGFDWDYGGTVYSWRKGKLAKPFGNQDHKVVVRLGYQNAEKLGKYIDKVIGDIEFSSKNKAMQRINPTIYQIIVDFP